MRRVAVLAALAASSIAHGRPPLFPFTDAANQQPPAKHGPATHGPATHKPSKDQDKKSKDQDKKSKDHDHKSGDEKKGGVLQPPCEDVPPPQSWDFPTCEAQLAHGHCALRKSNCESGRPCYCAATCEAECGSQSTAVPPRPRGPEDLGNGPVQAFNMHHVPRCAACGGNWCKKTDGKPDCVTFSFKDLQHVKGPDIGEGPNEVGCDALASMTPYCLDGDDTGIFAVSKASWQAGGYKPSAGWKAAPNHTVAPRVRNPKGHMLTVEQLNQLFEKGKPSNDLTEVGLVIHCVDGTERLGEVRGQASNPVTPPRA